MSRLFANLLFALSLAVMVPAVAAPAQAAQAKSPQAKPDQAGQVLNLKDADIQALITTVSQITGKNFIIGPNVQGKVTVVSTHPLSADEIYQVFLSVLQVHGYAAQPAGDGMIKIVNEATARTDGSVGAGDTGVGDPLVTRVVPVHNVPAAELASILQQFVPQGGKVIAHGPSNTLILSDRASVVNRLQEIIRRVDTSSDAQVEVIPLEHANAIDMARTLTQLDNASPATKPGGSVRVLADPRTNSILLSGDKSRRLRLRALVTHLDTPLASDGATQVIYLQHADAAKMVPILQNVARTLTGDHGTKKSATADGAAADSGNNNSNGTATIQSSDATNALIISAPPAVFRSLQSVIRKLDIRRAQVLIEAVIAEVGLQTAKQIGVQWQLPLKANADGSLDNSVIGGTNFTGPNGSGNILDLATNPLSLGGGLNLGYMNGSITLPGMSTPILQVGALIRALQQDGNTNILSTPSVVTLDNQEATVKVAQEVPFKTGQYTSTSSGGSNLPSNPFQTIERKDVGLTLTVTPHINAGDSVRMDIKQVVSSLAPQVSGAVDLITNTRSVETSVLVADDAMLVLGGLISNNTTDSNQKVPLLGDIPLIGNLFRYRSAKREKQDLMIFLHPKILRDAATEASVTSGKYNYIRTEQMDMRDDGALLTPVDQRPLLPQVHDFLASPPLPAKAPRKDQIEP